MNSIKFLFSSLFLYNLVLFNHIPAKAQITPDGTLGNESSQINSNVLIKGSNADQINGGATRGSNLFHSFSEFNISDGQRVYFANPSGVLNILTRVTGNNSSSILGTLGVDGNANLFLMNPNGILFGKNARLDVQGSFVGTTASGLQFGNQGVFSATNPQAPALLTVNPSALTFSQQQSGAITNQSQAPAGVSPNGNDTRGLRVPDGKSLLLVGGNVSVDDSGLRAYDGRVEVAGLAAPGNIGLNMTGDILSLNIPKDVTLADVFLSNNTGISVLGTFGGNIAINARNIDINSSSLFAGIAIGKGSPTTQAGDITLNATGNITLAGSLSSVNNRVYENANGNAGNIRISANSLTLKDNADLSTYTSGNGNAGNVFLQVNDAVTFDNSTIFSNVELNASGRGGDINIQAGSISLTQGSEINSKTFGQGDAGSININARNTVDLDGFVDTQLSDGTQGKIYSRIISAVNPEGKGKAGDIQIKTDILRLTNGAFISSSTLGQGSGGKVFIQADNNISIVNNSAIYSYVGTKVVGNAGGIDIKTGSLSLADGSELNSNTYGEGNAGRVSIQANNNISLANNSSIFSFVGTGSVGNAGGIDIKTGSLSLADGSKLNSNTYGEGNAGRVSIQANNNISLANNSSIFSNVEENSKGSAGGIDIKTGSLYLTQSSEVNSKTLGQGNGGDININALDVISLDGFRDTEENIYSRIISSVNPGATGKAGNIQIKAGSLQLTNGAFISSATSGSGDAGNLSVDANDMKLDSNTFIANSVYSEATGKGGNIRINTRELFLNNGGKISSDTYGQGNAGNIFIEASDILSLSNTKKIGFTQISSNVDSEAIGNAGVINIKTGNLSLDNAVITGFTSGKGNGGDINIQAGKLSLDNESYFLTSSNGIGKGGNVSIQAKDTISIANRSNISSETGTGGIGNAGNIDIVGDSFKLVNGSRLSTSSLGKGNAGNILINTTGNTTVQDSNIATFT
jgi:filamentous hemagglutinin family protein